MGYSTERKQKRWLMLSLLLSYLVSGCFWAREDHIVSKPTVKQDSKWKMEEGCGYERCGGRLVDFLVGKDLTIRIEAQNDEKDSTFAIRLSILPRDKVEIRFNPSLISVELADKRILPAKGFPCSGKIWNPSYRNSIPPINSTILVEELNCFLLFFDSPPPKIDEEYKMTMGGVFVGGQLVSIPEITFRKGISRW